MLHCAAQRGHIKVLEFILEELEDFSLDGAEKVTDTTLDLHTDFYRLERTNIAFLFSSPSSKKFAPNISNRSIIGSGGSMKHVCVCVSTGVLAPV